VSEFVLPANAGPKSPETYVISPAVAVSDELVVFDDRIARGRGERKFHVS
jgi:hypothetical protein